jgi:hypothetical protein
VKLLISKRKLLVVVTVCSLVAVIYWLMNWLLDPMRALKGFLEAIEQKDIDRIYSMTLSEERKAGLSKEQVAKVVGDLFYRHGNVKSEILITHRIADRWLYGYVLWWKVENGQKKPLPRTKTESSTIVARIDIFRPPLRLKWQVNFTRFTWGLLYYNYAPIKQWITKNPELKEERWKLTPMAKEWAKKQMVELWGIKEVFPLPVMARMRGKMRVFWGKWQEEE